MRASLRDRARFSAVALLWVTGLLAPLARPAAGADGGLFDFRTADSSDNRQWGDGGAVSYPGTTAGAPAPLFDLRIGALVLHRSSAQSNVVLTETTSGNALLQTSDAEPGWAGGTEVDFLLHITDTTDFEFDWYSVDDWANQEGRDLPGIFVNEAVFPLTTANLSISSRIRNYEFNIRQQCCDGLTVLAGFRYFEFLDSLGVQYGNSLLGFSQDSTIDVANKLYGIQFGAQAALWRSDCWEVDGWLKAGVYGNGASNSAVGPLAGSNPVQIVSMRAHGSQTAFLGDLGVRATRHFGPHTALFFGYRLIFVDGVALAANQYGRVQTFLNGGLPTITDSSSQLFQGIEAGLTFTF